MLCAEGPVGGFIERNAMNKERRVDVAVREGDEDVVRAYYLLTEVQGFARRGHIEEVGTSGKLLALYKRPDRPRLTLGAHQGDFIFRLVAETAPGTFEIEEA
jgi:hypothetical protein